MRAMKACLVVLLSSLAGSAIAQSVLNLQPSSPSMTQQRVVPVPNVQSHSSSLGQLPPSLSDRALSQLEPQPGESNAAFLDRMKSVSQKAVSEMERTLQEHNAKMKALAPK